MIVPPQENARPLSSAMKYLHNFDKSYTYVFYVQRLLHIILVLLSAILIYFNFNCLGKSSMMNVYMLNIWRQCSLLVDTPKYLAI